MVVASDLTGWWIGYGIGAAIVVVVALVVLAIIVTAKRIADVAEDATRSLARAREHTEPLWEVATTNQIASDLLAGARAARRALGGGGSSPEAETPTVEFRAKQPFATEPELGPESGR